MKDYNKYRKYNTRLDYFKIWSPNMAYILGYITADGYVKNNNKTYAIMFDISFKDIEILKFIQSEISDNCPIKIFERFSSFGRNKKAKLSISSKEIVHDLAKLNIIGNKSGREQYPNVPINYIGDYIRGFFDGDGCVSNTSKCLTITIVCINKQYLENLKHCVGNLGNIYQRKTKNQNIIYAWCISAQEEVLKFKNIIYYPGFNFCLKRKFDKIKNFEVRLKKYYEYRYNRNSFIFNKCCNCDIIFSHHYNSKINFCSQYCKYAWRKIYANT